MGRWLREFGAALVVALSGLVLDLTSALAVPQVFLAGDVPLAGNTSHPLQPLSEGGDGVDRASFRGVTVPGIYTVVFQVDGRHPKAGLIRRTETLSTFVRFGSAEARASALSVETLGGTAGQAEMAIRLRPRDSYGNFLGPDAAQEIHVALSDGMVAKEITDLGDGGYFISMLAPRSSDPTVTITVAGMRLYRGALSGLPRQVSDNVPAPHPAFTRGI